MTAKVLEQAAEIVRNKWPKGKGMKVLFIIGLVIASILGVVIMAFWLLGKLIKSITTGGFRNTDLYMPRMRRR